MAKINIAFAINDSYAEPMGIAIYSMLQNSPDNTFEIFVLCDKLQAKNEEILKILGAHFTNATIKIVRLGGKKKLFVDVPMTINHITKETYYRYILPDLFPQLNKMIYLDADVLVMGDIKKLWDMDVTNLWVAGVKDQFVENIYSVLSQKKRVQHKIKIGLTESDPYINAGVLLMNLDKIRHDKKVKRLFDNTIYLQDKILFQDQDIINVTFRGGIGSIENLFNYTDKDRLQDSFLDDQGHDNAVVIHYNGPVKPWDRGADSKDPFDETYFRYSDAYHALVFNTDITYALYKTTTENIGDDIQNIAAHRFLPFVNYLIDRDNIDKWRNPNPTRPVKLIANGWYIHYPFGWPPSDTSLGLLLISMYIDPHMDGSARLLSDGGKKYLQEFGPVGSRDKNTERLLKSKGIPAYFSGCLTLTLQKDARINKSDFVLLIDTSRTLFDYVRTKTKRRIIYLTNTSDPNLPTYLKQRQAELYLYLYQSAHCVITTRLHAALPSLALGTSVLLIDTVHTIDGKRDRFAGLEDLVHSSSEQGYIEDYELFNVDNPPANPDKHIDLRDNLINVCSEFTGHNNTDSFSRTNIPSRGLDEVLDELQFSRARALNDSGVAEFKSRQTTQHLESQLDDIRQQYDNTKQQQYALEAQLKRLDTIKGSARKVASNIKRKIRRTLGDA